jgi:hypothetical protein
MLGAELADAVFARNRVERHEPDIVPVALILVAWIAQADKQFH